MHTKEVYKILEIKEDHIVLETLSREILKALKTRMKIPKSAKVGDLIQHTEHLFYDVIDKDGNIISKW